nr:hypothetical protein [Chloroflexia bacterium]
FVLGVRMIGFIVSYRLATVGRNRRAPVPRRTLARDDGAAGGETALGRNPGQ